MDPTAIPGTRPVYVKSAALLLAVISGMTVLGAMLRHHSPVGRIAMAFEAALMLLFAWAFLEGKGWVRWVLLVPVSFGFLISPGYFRRASTFGAFYFCLVGLLEVAVLVLVFLGPSNEWFRGQKEHRLTRRLQATAR
jgi:hypothetical protein